MKDNTCRALGATILGLRELAETPLFGKSRAAEALCRSSSPVGRAARPRPARVMRRRTGARRRVNVGRRIATLVRHKIASLPASILLLSVATILPVLTFTAAYRVSDRKTGGDIWLRKGYFLSAAIDVPPASNFGALGITVALAAFAAVAVVRHHVVHERLTASATPQLHSLHSGSSSSLLWRPLAATVSLQTSTTPAASPTTASRQCLCSQPSHTSGLNRGSSDRSASRRGSRARHGGVSSLSRPSGARCSSPTWSLRRRMVYQSASESSPPHPLRS